MVGMDQIEVSPGGSKIAENSISLAVSGAAGILFTAVQLSFLSRFLEEGLFGLFVALRGFSLLLSTVILAGLPQVLIRFIPSYQSRGKKWKAVILFLGSTCVVLVLGCMLYFGSDIWKGWMPESVRSLSLDGGIIHWVTLASVALAMKLLLFGGFSGLREMRMQMFLEPVYLFFLTVYIVVNRNDLGVERLFRLIFFLNLAIFLVGLPIFIRFLQRLIRDCESPKPEGIVLPTFFPYWGGSIALSFVALAFTDVDRFVMSSVLPVSAISIFHVASRIHFILKRFLGIPVIAAQPEITRVYEEGRIDELTGVIALFTKVVFVASLLVTGLAIVIGNDVISVLSGSEYGYAYIVLLFLLPTIPISAIVAPLVITMRSLHYIRWAVLCDFVWMAVYFGSFFLFVSIWGVVGMAVAQIIATAVQLITAVSLAKREGFYRGFGSRSGRLLIALIILVPLGILITGRLGMPASALCLILFPPGCRILLGRLGVFESSEKKRIVELIPVRLGRRTAAWLLSMES